MTVILQPISDTRIVTIRAAEAEFRLHLRRPSFAEQLALDALYSLCQQDLAKHYHELILARLDVITTWDGVLDQDGRPVPYSRAALLQLLADRPDLATVVMQECRTQCEGLTPGERGGGPANSSAAAAHRPSSEPAASSTN